MTENIPEGVLKVARKKVLKNVVREAYRVADRISNYASHRRIIPKDISSDLVEDERGINFILKYKASFIDESDLIEFMKCVVNYSMKRAKVLRKKGFNIDHAFSFYTTRKKFGIIIQYIIPWQEVEKTARIIMEEDEEIKRKYGYKKLKERGEELVGRF